jgi:hypothetical protein
MNLHEQIFGVLKADSAHFTIAQNILTSQWTNKLILIGCNWKTGAVM